MKVCYKCRNPKSPFGKHPYMCLSCHADYMREYRIAHGATPGKRRVSKHKQTDNNLISQFLRGAI